MKHLTLISLLLLLLGSCSKDFSVVDNLSTGDISKTTNSTAIVNIDVAKNDQTKEVGVLISTSPLLDCSKAQKDTATNLTVNSITLTGLTAGTHYYYRAYATDGTHYIYGDIKEFNTTNHKIIAIAAGSTHFLAIDETGTLWGWGWNDDHQLGNPNERFFPYSIVIKEGTKFKAIATTSHSFYSAAIDENGNLWLWGSKYSGIPNYPTPIQVMPGNKFKTITAGSDNLLTIDTNGNIWALGAYYPYESSLTWTQINPIQIKSDVKFKAIAAGSSHYMAIDESGNLWVWGENYFKQFGCSSPLESLVPIQIMPGTKFKTISATDATSYAIDEDENTWVWGDNIQLGIYPISRFSTIQPTIIGKNFQTMATNTYFSVGIDTNKSLCGWGNILESPDVKNLFLQVSPSRPLFISNEKFQTIAAGPHSALAIDENGKLWGIGTTFLNNRNRTAPVTLSLINQF